MRILIVSQYFWPEYFRVNDLVIELKKENEVDVFTGYPNYPEGNIYEDFKKKRENYSSYNGVNIYRVPLIPRGNGSKFMLTLNYISFLLSSFLFGPFILRKKKYDLVLTFGTSPILVGFIGILFAKLKKSLCFIWVLDLWPNVLQDLKILKKESFIYKLCKLLVKFIYFRTDCILAQSLSFKKEIKQLIPQQKNKIVYFPSWPEDISEIKEEKFEKKFFFDKSYINIVFAGNIGESQNFEYIVKKIIFNLGSRVRWHIFGEGRYNQKLKKIIELNNIKNIFLYGHVKFNHLQKFLNCADFLLISLKYEKTFSSTIPGKFQTYLHYEKPILGFLSGEVADIIKKYDLGLVYNYMKIPKINDLENYLAIENNLKKNSNILKKIFSKKRGIKKLLYYANNYNKIFPRNKIKIITDTNFINYEKNFILSGLNLAFLGHYVSEELNFSKNQIYWLDGYYKKKLINDKNLPKLPGRKLVENLEVDNSIVKNVYIIGSASINVKKYLKKKFFDYSVKYIELPMSNKIEDFYDLIPNFKKEDIVFLTLPTPKQEKVAYYIQQKSAYYKIFCIGGALNMLAGDEIPVPKKIENFIFTESIWRLQTSPIRRTIRAFKSIFFFNFGLLFGIFKKIDYEVIKSK